MFGFEDDPTLGKMCVGYGPGHTSLGFVRPAATRKPNCCVTAALPNHVRDKRNAVNGHRTRRGNIFELRLLALSP